MTDHIGPILDAHRIWLMLPTLAVYEACDDSEPDVVERLRDLLDAPPSGPAGVTTFVDAMLCAHDVAWTLHRELVAQDPAWDGPAPVVVQAASCFTHAAAAALGAAGLTDEELLRTQPALAARMTVHLGIEKKRDLTPIGLLLTANVAGPSAPEEHVWGYLAAGMDLEGALTSYATLDT